MPVAAAIASPAHMRPTAIAVSLVFACAALGYSLYKVRRAEWIHIDASVPTERAQLSARVGVGFLASAGAFWLAGPHVGFPLVVGLSGLIVAAGYVFKGMAKLSLHVAFAVFAAFLAWPNHVAAATFALAAAGVAWSRLALQRHVAADIILGALAGTVAGVAFHAAVARLAT
jgi:hypothetical protein